MELAAGLLTDGKDGFRQGLVALRRGCHEEAASMLDTTIDNPWLEGYRLYYRARAHLADSAGEAALSDAVRLAVHVRSSSAMQDFPLIRSSNDILAEAALLSGNEEFIEKNNIYSLSPLSAGMRLLLSKKLIEEGRNREAAIHLLSGLKAGPGNEDAQTIARIIDGIRPHLSVFDCDELFRLGLKVLETTPGNSVNRFIKQIIRRFPKRHEAEYLKGLLYLRGEDLVKALKVFQRLFRSEASVYLKREALYRAASIQYEMKRYGRAAESYRIFGMYYPDDPKSTAALDLAARIEVSRKRYREALAIWENLRDRGKNGDLALEAAVSEAVLRSRTGEREKANRILKQILPRASYRIEAAVLYWLIDTAGSGDDIKHWRERLETRYPYSFYTAVLADERYPYILSQDGTYKAGKNRLLEMESLERASFGTILCRTLSNNHAADSHPGYEAYEYFLKKGFLTEAGECGRSLARIFRSDGPVLEKLYVSARSTGLIELGLSYLNIPALAHSMPHVNSCLKYPVAFTTMITEHACGSGLDAELVLAVIREESRFDPEAVSRSGALGLMQLMPTTGKWAALKTEIGAIEDADLFDPEINITMGCWYLHYLMDRFDGSIADALAAYNAGASRMSRWRKQFRPLEDPVAAIEMIGVRETRHYVKRVLDAVTAYRILYINSTVMQ